MAESIGRSRLIPLGVRSCKHSHHRRLPLDVFRETQYASADGEGAEVANTITQLGELLNKVPAPNLDLSQQPDTSLSLGAPACALRPAPAFDWCKGAVTRCMLARQRVACRCVDCTHAGWAARSHPPCAWQQQVLASHCWCLAARQQQACTYCSLAGSRHTAQLSGIVRPGL